MPRTDDDIGLHTSIESNETSIMIDGQSQQVDIGNLPMIGQTGSVDQTPIQKADIIRNK